METPESIVRTAEEKLAAAEQQLTHTEAALVQLEEELSALEADVRDIGQVRASVWPSFRLGLAPPVSLLAAGFFFDTGVWPLGLLAALAIIVQLLMLPRLNRGPR